MCTFISAHGPGLFNNAMHPTATFYIHVYGSNFKMYITVKVTKLSITLTYFDINRIIIKEAMSHQANLQFFHTFEYKSMTRCRKIKYCYCWSKLEVVFKTVSQILIN